MATRRLEQSPEFGRADFPTPAGLSTTPPVVPRWVPASIGISWKIIRSADSQTRPKSTETEETLGNFYLRSPTAELGTTLTWGTLLCTKIPIYGWWSLTWSAGHFESLELYSGHFDKYNISKKHNLVFIKCVHTPHWFKVLCREISRVLLNCMNPILFEVSYLVAKSPGFFVHKVRLIILCVYWDY